MSLSPDPIRQSPTTSFDGGTLDCGNGLLLLIRRHIDPLEPGQLLEILSAESSVAEDLPAWCRLTGNELVAQSHDATRWRFLVSRGGFHQGATPGSIESRPQHKAPAVVETREVATASLPQDVPTLAPLSVLGIGSWPRPGWMVRALHEHLAGRLSEVEFQQTADDAVRLAIAAQERAGVDLVTDGEQRRDNYASFVGGLLDNCQLVPITDLLPYVDDPAKFQAELAALDVPADRIRHPAVFGRLQRSRTLAGQELALAQKISSRPIKVALPGPYLLTRTMWLECISDQAYESREELATDIVRVLREEAEALLAAGAAIVQFDEPVLTEVVHGRSSGNRVFMCGALGSRNEAPQELDFAAELLHRLLDGMPRERLALHVCRGNWTTDESVALAGDYRPLVPLLGRLAVGTLLLEMCTPRAGDEAVIKSLARDYRIGVGVVNPKSAEIETIEAVLARAERAIGLFGAERVVLHPDCGFATFADSPVASAEVAEQKLKVVVAAARRLRDKYGLTT